MFRKKGIIGIALLVVLTAALFYFFTDKWLERQVEDTGTELNRALVEIDNMHMSLLDLQIRWDRLQVTDPSSTMKNTLETGECEFDLELVPLLSGKVIVEDFVVKDLRRNTDRESDGKIDLPETNDSGEPGFIESAVSSLESELADAPVMNLDQFKNKVNADSVLSMLEIKSPRKIDSLKTAVIENYENWEKRLSEVDLQKDYSEIKAKVNSIDVKKLKNVQDVVKAVATLNEIKTKTESIKQNFEVIKQDLSADLTETAKVKDAASEWIQTDYRNALSNAKLPDFTAENIGKLLFGEKVVSNLKQYLNYANTARGYYRELAPGESSEEETTPPRLHGKDVYFYDQNAQPDFWLKNIDLSGETETNLALNGKVTDVASDQRLTRKPTEIALSGSDSKGSSLSFNGLMKYFEGEPAEIFSLNYSGFDLSGYSISESPLLPNKIKTGLGKLDAGIELVGNSIDGKINFNASQVVFESAEPANGSGEIEQMVQRLIAKVDNVKFTAEISGTQNDIKFSLRSNLDKLFSDNLKSLLGEEVEKLKQKLNAKVNAETNKYKEQLFDLVDSKYGEYSGILSTLGIQSDSINNLLNSKNQELEKKKKELEGNLTKKLIDKIF